MTRRRSAVLGVLVLGFGGAWMTGACGGPLDPGPLDACAALPEAPLDEPTECAEPMQKPCMLYRIPLLGNPTENGALRGEYIAAFGSACYMSAGPIPTFNCFYKTWQSACADAVKIGKVSGNAEYDEGYECQPVGNGDYTLQVGPDPAIKIPITYEDAPLATSLIEIKTVPTEVNGPYRNLVEVTTVKPEKDFNCTSGQVGADGKTMSQRKWILEVNRKAHGGKIHSDLAGFTWPCDDENCKPTTCTEKLVLLDPADKNTPENDPDRAQVHHVVPRKDPRGCRWGTNAYKNAAVISTRLNQHLTNKVPPIKEVDQINKVPPYSP
ncbi:hypothetical protein [Polyangium spumosum]|uniref:Uncharacterized protein n=1 Tax=Polyangium spumosum TaxID=889282 RepID=A0A6N7PYY5_9BACT|nr:hypothetical protein [Polyangium spumosum]MRG95690.1 hypothetical protein [Polyangium spumosum]